MRRVINSVISETQMAFVKNRQILDSFVIVEEVIHHWKKCRKGGLLVKLDFKKAYDRRILRCFELASGLGINFQKTCVVKVGKREMCEDNWAGIFRCGNATIPISYLGLPLGGRSGSKNFWTNLVLRVERRLAPWKKRFLNIVSNLFAQGSDTVGWLKEGLKLTNLVVFEGLGKERGVIGDGINLRRNLFDWEVEQWNCFQGCLLNVHVRDSIQDSLGDHRGKVICIFSESIGIHDPISADILNLVVVSDSKVAFEWVNISGMWSIEHAQTILNIRINLAMIGQALVCFGPINSNSFSDALAKKGSQDGDGMLFWNDI
ncbi:hypothetical protein Dsin_015037 [Dipteronia sinensis]|uniref:Reverse transcriptase domain-containing protein n=1 Tax=Dipteronia sinensis TaxID=43782 RepID=A0AAE0AP92_9ROSI|nr:hypothetical protein Dsin_015037 [Dipteronia sinensis]